MAHGVGRGRSGSTQPARRASATAARIGIALALSTVLIGSGFAKPLSLGAIAQDGSGLPSLDLMATEGALRNNGFVPVDEAAAENLAAADELWRTGRAVETLDGWQRALAESSTGAIVPWLESTAAPADDAPPPRAFEGVEEALLSRLELWPEALDAWRERFEDASIAEFEDSGGSVAALAQLERRLPATTGALRAALVLGDRAFETGSPVAARTWCARAARHARRIGDGRFEAAVEARLAATTPIGPYPRAGL